MIISFDIYLQDESSSDEKGADDGREGVRDTS
jgi:hypothetical protein